jgi:hypothetical protein
MSKTLFVEFRGDGFWAFDVVSAVFLKHLIDVATPFVGHAGGTWLADAVARWREDAVISDFGLFLDDIWTVEQVETFTALAVAACDALSRRDVIPAEEIESWLMVDDLRCYARGLPFVTTASAVRLGRAVIRLVNGTLPEPPTWTWWFFSTDDAPTTIQKGQN